MPIPACVLNGEPVSINLDLGKPNCPLCQATIHENNKRVVCPNCGEPLEIINGVACLPGGRKMK